MESAILAIYEWVAWFGEAYGSNFGPRSFFASAPRGRGTLVAHPTHEGEAFTMTFHAEPADA